MDNKKIKIDVPNKEINDNIVEEEDWPEKVKECLDCNGFLKEATFRDMVNKGMVEKFGIEELDNRKHTGYFMCQLCKHDFSILASEDSQDVTIESLQTRKKKFIKGIKTAWYAANYSDALIKQHLRRRIQMESDFTIFTMPVQ